MAGNDRDLETSCRNASVIPTSANSVEQERPLPAGNTLLAGAGADVGDNPGLARAEDRQVPEDDCLTLAGPPILRRRSCASASNPLD